MQLLICSQTCILAVSLQESYNHMFVRELCRKKNQSVFLFIQTVSTTLDTEHFISGHQNSCRAKKNFFRRYQLSTKFILILSLDTWS